MRGAGQYHKACDREPQATGETETVFMKQSEAGTSEKSFFSSSSSPAERFVAPVSRRGLG